VKGHHLGEISGDPEDDDTSADDTSAGCLACADAAWSAGCGWVATAIEVSLLAIGLPCGGPSGHPTVRPGSIEIITRFG
jgi:hypothetical protein